MGHLAAVRKSHRHRLATITLSVLLSLTGIALAYNLTLPAGRRHAAASVALIARAVPRATGYRVSRCRPAARNTLGCEYELFIRALSGGTITCTARVRVRAAITSVRRHGRLTRTPALTSSFPGRPRCVRRPAGRGRSAHGSN